MSPTSMDTPAVALTVPGRPLAPAETALPALLQDASRAAGGALDPFINGAVVQVEAAYDISALVRGQGLQTAVEPAAARMLVLEAADGTTLFLRADTLREELERLYPDAVRDGRLDLSVLRDRDAAARGLADWVWSRLSVLRVKPDAIIDRAKDKAREWVLERLGEGAKDRVEQLAGFSTSVLGARALMWAIESRLAGEPGLYQWRAPALAVSDRLRADDPGLAAAAQAGPLLVFVHGTASHTAASFGDLRSAGAALDWAPLRHRFGERVYAFEHRTFSESPIDNALALAEILPRHARLALVTHSRGGLVGDLLCLGGLDDGAIAEYRLTTGTAAGDSAEQRALQRAVAAEEQEKLRRLRDLLAFKDFRVERYVRVACPARGTRLLSDNLEVFLSGLLSLMGTLVGAVAGPAASPVLSAFKRIVLEIADKRLDPHLVPGIEAMLTDAPMGRLLARAPRKQGLEMAVITGDMEGGGLLKRLGVLFTDWMFFERRDNDLVVDTDSMYAGLAWQPGAHYLFDQGPGVNHFSYFANRRTRQALRDWLTLANPAAEVSAFRPLAEEQEATVSESREFLRSAGAARPPVDTRPVLVLLPGIMGTHLEIRHGDTQPGSGNRVWFDPFHLARGGLREIRYGEPHVREEALFRMYYGALWRHLEATHAVIPFPYDWRLPVQKTAERLAETVAEALTQHPHQPVRLLAHSMGGLVARAMIAQRPDLWRRLVERPGGRLLMLGTPNNGSHLMVETLLGKAGTVRKLARLDFAHPLQGVLDIIAAFPGAVQLLPRPGFVDAANSQAGDYLVSGQWEEYRKLVKDRWFGDGTVGVPTPEALVLARALWEGILAEQDGAHWRHRPIESAERVGYVFGKADNTPCGVTLEKGRLRMLGTPEGDGSVTWASGRLDFLALDRHCWYMPAAHGNLADTREYFPALVDLLQSGTTTRLGRLPAARGTAAVHHYDAGPEPYPTAEELARSLLTSRPRPLQPTRARQRLAVRVLAMDLRNAQLPVLCGHYLGDPIAGAEAQIDRHLVAGALSRRERLGLYAGAIGTTALVVAPASEESAGRGTCKGAIIVGLGRMGELTLAGLSETVRAGVLRFLLHARDREWGRDLTRPARASGVQAPALGLASLLVGYNSSNAGEVESFLDAILLGVCEANRQFAEAGGAESPLQVSRLEFIEVFRDTAITAAHALRGSARRLSADLQRLEMELESADRLVEGDGVRPRLQAGGGFGYWPRLLVSDADRPEPDCPPECYEATAGTAATDAPGRAPGEREAPIGTGNAAGSPSVFAPAQPPGTGVATRLKYVYLSARARAETVVHQRQPGLVEALVRPAIGQHRYNAALACTLFHILVPLELKATAQSLERLVLVVDGYTANLPWELLQAGAEPLALKTAVVRQLASTRFRRSVRGTALRNACVIVDPATRGFLEHFGTPADRPLPALPGAVAEGQAVRRTLESQHYQVTFVPAGTAATEVLARLLCCAYRILVMAAHGVYRAAARDGGLRTGVVLSDGVLLTAAELGGMEVVPEVVFLNCCHLGEVDPTPLPGDVNRLAYSLARELIEMGARCVLVAGWAVDDQAARTFAETFFEELVARGRPFGMAVHAARRATYDGHRESNTWGAYQAYGDPGFVLDPGGAGVAAAPTDPVSPRELLAELEALHSDVKHRAAGPFEALRRTLEERLRAVPADWVELPEVQAALGALYGEFGPEGFEAARRAYLRAINGEDRAGRVPIRAIEQLANLEARTARRLGPKAGVALVRRAISRLEHLRDLTAEADTGDAGSGASPVNLERSALLGNAYKLAAELSLTAGRGGKPAATLLLRARDAYRAGEGPVDQPTFNPYALLNRLQLEALLGAVADLPAALALAARAGVAARARFHDSYDFWDAVMVADAELAGRLLEGSVEANEAGLIRSYEDAVTQVPNSERQLDSVAGQLRFLALAARARGQVALGETLDRIAQRLGAPVAPPPAGPAEEESAAGNKPRRGGGGSPRRPPVRGKKNSGKNSKGVAGE